MRWQIRIILKFGKREKSYTPMDLKKSWFYRADQKKVS
jgi:hypothetical protein